MVLMARHNSSQMLDGVAVRGMCSLVQFRGVLLLQSINQSLPWDDEAEHCHLGSENYIKWYQRVPIHHIIDIPIPEHKGWGDLAPPWTPPPPPPPPTDRDMAKSRLLVVLRPTRTPFKFLIFSVRSRAILKRFHGPFWRGIILGGLWSFVELLLTSLVPD